MNSDDRNLETVMQKIQNLPVIDLEDETGRKAYAEMAYGDSRFIKPLSPYILMDGKATFVNPLKGAECSITREEYQKLTSGKSYSNKGVVELIGIVL